MDYKLPEDLIGDDDVIKYIASTIKNMNEEVGIELEKGYRYAIENNCKIGYKKTNASQTGANAYFENGIETKMNDINKLVYLWSDNPPYPALIHQLELTNKSKKDPTNAAFIIIIPKENLENDSFWEIEKKQYKLKPEYIFAYVYNDSGYISKILLNPNFIKKEKPYVRTRNDV